MKTEINANSLDMLFETLANKHRREIILLLSFEPISISDLATMRDLSLQAIHKHINVLVDAGMVTRAKAGRTTFLTFNRGSMRGLQSWINQFQAKWDGGLETLENYAQTIEFKNQITPKSHKEKK